MSRKSIDPDFDAVVDFFPPETLPEFVYGLVKRSYEVRQGRCRRCAVEPLFHDIRDPTVEPKWSPGSDFWPTRALTDVVVRGSAYGPGGRQVAYRSISVRVGRRYKRIMVYGDRVVEWKRGQLRFGPPDPFSEMPIVWSRAYGGCDPRVPVKESPRTVATLAKLEFDHPGVYPRNPFGRGYVVVDEPVEGIVLPNLEDPAHPLTPNTFVTRDPRLWYTQPLPAGFEFTNAMMFHRLCWLGLEAWYHPPALARLEEVERGALPANYLDLRQLSPATPLPLQAMQEGSIGMVFPPIAAGTPIIVEGMHPEYPQLQLELPRAPSLELIVDGRVFPVKAQLSIVLIEPDKQRVSLTYVARQEKLPRVFVPGLHADIPLAMRIDKERTVQYEAPPTLREQRMGADASTESS